MFKQGNVASSGSVTSHSSASDASTNDEKRPLAGSPNKATENAFVIKLAVIASMSGLLFGYDTGVVSGAVIYLRPDMGLTNLEVEIIVSSTILSAAISAFAGHYLMDMKGRKATLVWASTIFVIGSLIMACAFGPRNGYLMLVFGRLFVGCAIGIASEAGPLYISECAPPNLRGSLTTLFNVAVVGGQIFASIVCGLFSSLPLGLNWRMMLAFGAVPALAQMVGFSMLPLSPSWLVLQGREDEAEEVLRRIRDTPDENDDQYTEDPIMHELNEIIEERQIAAQHEHVSICSLWKNNKAVRRMMILGCGLWAVSQLAGINTIMYYGASIVRRSGIEGDRAFDIWVTVPLNTMQLLGIFVCFSVIDKKGRRWTLLTSMTMVCISLILMGTGFALNWSILTLTAMCLYLFSFGVGLSTMPYTMNSEIYPNEYRGVCVAQATGVFWFSNFIVSLTFLTLAKYLSNCGVFMLYAAIVFVSEIWLYFIAPETSGLSLHEIQLLFEEPQNEQTRSLSVKDLDHYYGSTEESQQPRKRGLELSAPVKIV